HVFSLLGAVRVPDQAQRLGRAVLDGISDRRELIGGALPALGTDLGPGPLTDREPVERLGLALGVPLAQVEVDLYAHRFLLSSNAALSTSSRASLRPTAVRAGRPL